MTGRTFIDGKDIYTSFGAFVTEGGYADLARFPSLKSVEYNDWHEEDGIEPDLSDPKLDTKEITITFAIRGGKGKTDDLIQLLSDKVSHLFDFREIGLSVNLRLASASAPTVAGQLRLLPLTFADDSPLEDYEYAEPHSSMPQITDCLIDGRKLSDYGVRLLQGTQASLERIPDVKMNLLRNIAGASGALYDTEGEVTYKSRDVTLQCLMRAPSLAEFWLNRNALLYDLVRPDERVLSAGMIGRDFKCFYKSMSVIEFIPVNGVWMKFSLNLTVTNDGALLRESCYAEGYWIDSGIWRMTDAWKNSPDAA